MEDQGRDRELLLQATLGKDPAEQARSLKSFKRFCQYICMQPRIMKAGETSYWGCVVRVLIVFELPATAREKKRLITTRSFFQVSFQEKN